MRNKNISILISIALIIAGTWVYTSTNVNKNCVTVFVDYGVLKSNATATAPVCGIEKVNALDAVKQVGLSVDGTDKYGSQIACRVNGLPSATKPVGVKNHEDYIETCADMPASFAYWAVIVKRGALPWGWAETGIDKVELKSGDSVGLVFAENDNVRFPN